jgi:hypothetical protein
MNCDLVFQNVIEMNNQSKDSLFVLSQCFLDGYDLKNLLLMLRSEDIGIVSDGLFISGEIGRLAIEVSGDLKKLSKSFDEDIRNSAEEILKNLHIV